MKSHSGSFNEPVVQLAAQIVGGVADDEEVLMHEPQMVDEDALIDEGLLERM